MLTITSNTEPDVNWNKRLFNSGLGTIYQTIERGIFVKTLNRPTHFLKFLDENQKIVGQLLVDEIPRFEQNNSRKKFLGKIPGIKKTIYTWVSGPVIFEQKYATEIYEVLYQFLKSKKTAIDGWTHPLAPGNPAPFQKYFQIIKWGTHLIDLSKTKEEIYENIDKHSGRKNIERSIKRGVTVEEITEKSLFEFNELINSMRDEAGREKSDIKNLKRRWKLFKPVGFSGFLAKKDKTPIGGLLFYHVNGHILEAGVARSKIDTKEKLYSQDLIKWKIIEWGLENKMRFFNLNGFNPNPISEKEKGIKRYKEKWGGKPYYYFRILQKPNILTNKI